MGKSYSTFDSFFIRTPKEPLQFLINFLQEGSCQNERFKNKPFLESLYIASPELYKETLKWLSGYSFSEKEEQKLKYSLYKYLARMSSRCTPFGLFAGFNIGEIEESTNIIISSNPEEKIRYRATRLDMNYACALGQYLAKQESIREQIKFYPNNSIYNSADKLRYVEYIYGRKTQRLHQISAVDRNEYLLNILTFAKNGKTIENLAAHIVEEEISFDEAKDFILELVKSQILVSELDPQITNPDYWGMLIAKLSSIDGCEQIVDHLNEVKAILDQLDYQPIGVDVEEYYERIKSILKKFDVDYEEKFLFQSDKLTPLKYNKVGRDIPLRVLEGIELLNKLSIAPSETNLSKFVSEFSKRYDDLEVELTIALDPEMGLGYPIGNSINSDLSPLLDGLMMPIFQQTQKQIVWDHVQLFLLKKYQDALKKNAYCIELTEEEFNHFPVNKNPLPNTISAMVELIPPEKEGGENRIVMGSSGGNSALCLIGRFCHTGEIFYSYAQEIAQKEIELAEGVIVAEIVHLPEARTGNILMHPKFFDYEIPYLATQNVDQNHTINISDLMISVKQNKIFLRSKKYNKQVTPRLSNAHNFSNNSLPVYRFLCDLQAQDYIKGVGFHWGNFANDFSFLPRVTYKNLILFEATWNLKKKDTEPLLKVKDDVELKVKVDSWRKELRLPNLVTLADGDNELLIDFTNLFSFKVLLDTVKKRESFNLKEFLHHPEKNPIKDEEGRAYVNQLVFAFYKNISQKGNEVVKNKKKKVDFSLN